MYLTHLGACTMPKNQLDTAIRKYLKAVDRVKIEDAEVEDFMYLVQRRIKKLNAEFSRCKKHLPTWRRGVNGKDYILNGVEGCSFILYASSSSYHDGNVCLQTVE